MIWLHKNKPLIRIVIAYMIMSHLLQILVPSTVFALTSGPAQPEFASFKPVGVSDLVNPSTGDFSYDVNLMDVDGYPLMAFYSGINNIEEEASMLGLGWNLNLGSLNRQMRGFPDEFAGDEIKTEFNLKPNMTVGFQGGPNLEFLGIEKVPKFLTKGKELLKPSWGIHYNNYRGFGWEASINPSLSASKPARSGKLLGLSLGFKLSINSESGLGFDPKLSFSAYQESVISKAFGFTLKEYSEVGVSLSGSYNSVSGLKSLSLSAENDKGKIIKTRTKTIKRSRAGGSTSGPIASFSHASYTMQPKHPFMNTTIPFNFKMGGAAVGAFPNIKLSGYFSKQLLLNKTKSTPTYGWFHLEGASNNKRALMDVNREKDGPLIEETTVNLAVPQATYDLYSINGHGVGGMFRGMRSDRGILTDGFTQNLDVGLNPIAVEVGTGGPFAHFGGNAGANGTISSSGRWKKHNELATAFKFQKDDPGNDFYEPYYYQKLGEPVVDTDPSFNAKIGGEDAVRVMLDSKGGMRNHFRKADKTAVIGSSSYTREKRAIRNTLISSLAAKDARYVGFETGIQEYDLDESSGVLTLKDDDNDGISIPRISGVRQYHHPSEFTVLGEGGSRYLYGIPAYVNFQKDVSFNASVNDPSSDDYVDIALNCEDGTVLYTPNQDNSTKNDLGIDKFFNSTELPPYANNYLLTAVLSSDYVDITGDGVSDDDLGTAYKINYTREHDNYKWRVPFLANQAKYGAGFKSQGDDDRGSYSYGEKEVWYIKSVEGPNSVAEFHYNDIPRKDGYGVANENGGLESSVALRYLKEIVLYSKKERQTLGPNAIPIKTAHFVQDYELCPGIHNNIEYDPDIDPKNNPGKLTLKKIYFTYGNSQKAKYNFYDFTYGDPFHTGQANQGSNPYNPPYSPNAIDRWGNYKPNSCANGQMPNWEFPYTDQRVIPPGDPFYDSSDDTRTYADAYAQVWKLSSIKTPSGGEIQIDYESNDYAYVEDRKAMQMFKIAGIGPDADPANMGAFLYEKVSGTLGSFINHNYLFLDLDQEISSTNDFKQKYLSEVDPLYFNFYMDVTGKGRFEQVVGYVEVEDAGYINAHQAWIKIEELTTKDDGKGKKVPAISRKAWDFVKTSMPGAIFDAKPDGSLDMETEYKKVAKGIVAFLNDISKYFKGVNRMFRSRGYGRYVELEKSWLRLNTPDGHKHGGGARVSEIRILDNAQSMGFNTGNVYGQVYEYTTIDEATGDKVSSGVATYEPMVGGDEIPHRVPREYRKENKWVADDLYYFEEPFGESFFPSPQIIYSEVRVRNLPKPGVTHNATGYVKHEFYTAKDFPTRTDETDLHSVNKKPNPVGAFLGASTRFANATQGYSVWVNDMAGRSKAQWTYGAKSDKYISGVEYVYRTKADGDKQILDNDNVLVIKDDNTTSYESIGKEIDFTVDARQDKSETFGVTQKGNIDLIALWIPALNAFPSFIYSNLRARTVSTSKLIRQYGLLEKVIAYDGGACVATENVAYDAETGGVILTKTTNEFKDPLYNLSLPSHWAYDQMGHAHQNHGLSWTGQAIFNLTAKVPGSDELYFVEGDELLIEGGGEPAFRAWVLDVNTSTNKIAVVRRDGSLVDDQTFFDEITIIRSGRKNLQSSSMGSVATKSDPLTNNFDNFDNVLAASAVEYRDDWQMLCGLPVATCNCVEVTDDATAIQQLLNDMIDGGTSIVADNPVDIDGYLTNSPLTNTVFSSNANCAQYKAVGTPSGGCAKTSLDIDLGHDCQGAFTSLMNISLSAVDPQNSYCLEFFDYFENIQAINVDPDECEDTYDFQIDGVIPIDCNNGSGDVVVTFTGTINTNGFPIRSCTSEFSNLCGNEGDIVNPYVKGLKGNWNSEVAYTYLTDRFQSQPTASVDPEVRHGGEFKGFSAFWKYTSGEWTPDDNKWQWTAKATKRIPEGFDVESVDPLGRYASVLYGYNVFLPIATVANARYENTLYTPFEEKNDIDKLCGAHFYFNEDVNSFIEDQQAHSGYQSARIHSGERLSIGTKFFEECTPETEETPYELRSCDCAGYFSPESGQKYVVSLWVKSEAYDQSTPVFSYTDATVELKADGSQITPLSSQRSKIIDGWQQVEYIFDIPATATNTLEIEFVNSGSKKIYIDDLRVHPANSQMTTFVYDPVTHWLLRTGDINGYSEFYSYDNEGTLTGVKKETEEGIMTLQTNRQQLAPRTFN